MSACDVACWGVLCLRAGCFRRWIRVLRTLPPVRKIYRFCRPAKNGLLSATFRGASRNKGKAQRVFSAHKKNSSPFLSVFASVRPSAPYVAATSRFLSARNHALHLRLLQHDTPKYGLIYHASLIGQATPKNKGKISRVLAAKCSLAIRVDALADDTDTTIGMESRAKV